MGKPHKHAELIKAWADGAQIQYQWVVPNGEWIDIETPDWRTRCPLRIKPEEKKPVLSRYDAIKAAHEKALGTPCERYLQAMSLAAYFFNSGVEWALHKLEENPDWENEG